MRPTFPVRFVPGDRVFAASGPVELFLAAAACDILVDQPCGSAGTCGKCRVRLLDGAPEPTSRDQELLSRAEIEAGWRLGCQLVLRGPATVELLAPSRLTAAKSFGDPGPIPPGFSPVFHVCDLDVQPASLDRQQSDLERLGEAARFDAPLRAAPAALAELRERLSTGSSLRAVIHAGSLVACERAGGPGPWGLAIDIGSTTLAVAIVSLADGHVEAALSRLNPQVAFGADVMTRIHVATHQADGGLRLTLALRGGLAGMVRDVVDIARIDPRGLVAAACVGNPTMLHTWLGVDPTPLGQAPYVGTWTGEVACSARDVDLPVHPNASIYAFPSLRSHVGADAVAAAVATAIDLAERPCLLMDLGTNSEVVVGCREGLVAASTAAGPAFEGASISCGMRAERGAIDAVSVAPGGELAITTIEHAPAAGICGSGLIDAVAELLQAGAINPSGYLRSADELLGTPAEGLRPRVANIDGRRVVVLADDAERGGRPVALTAPDIRQLQLAKGSIRAGITVLCRELALRESDLDQVLIAGTFGSYVRKASVLRIGLVPPVDPERVHFVGNAAGVGARLALVDRRVRDRARHVAARTRYVELASHAGYVDAFHAALSFPEDGGAR